MELLQVRTIFFIDSSVKCKQKNKSMIFERDRIMLDENLIEYLFKQREQQ